MKPLDLLDAADLLLTEQGLGPPRQTYLKRAISNAYYALFHYLCAMCADCLVGASRRNTRAWLQVYRALDHGAIKRQCNNQSIMSQFPEVLRELGEKILELQAVRSQADYNLASRFSLREVQAHVDDARDVINKMSSVSKQDRTDFAIWNLFRYRP